MTVTSGTFRPGLARVVIRGMNPTTRGPSDTILAQIDDASNIGASEYMNSPGEFHMTLPIQHEQAGNIEPWRSHYALQAWHEPTQKYVTRFCGIITDFDANDNDIIYYGIDYYALLDKVIDTRYTGGKIDQPPPNGSYYSGKTLSYIINDLLVYADAKTHSPVKFITRKTMNSYPEAVSIYTTFTAIGSMIAGLIESHRQGTGKRTRFWVGRNSDTVHYWMSVDNPGVDRPAMKMEYGGLVQGFQIVGFGADFSSTAHAVGRTQTGAELFYKSANAPGLSLNSWGRIETVQFIDNVTDANDLQRRVKQAAASAGRVGKRVALGIKVGEIMPFDGYQICDSIPVHIRRGAIDTKRYGGAMWTIVGVEWRVYPDGHGETTLVLLPKEDGTAPRADLMAPSEMVPTQPITATQIPDGSISSEKIEGGAVGTAQLAVPSVQNQHLDGAVVKDENVDPAGLDAGKITSGDLVAGGIVGDGTASSIIVRDALGVQIGKWSNDGLLIYDEANPSLVVRLNAGVLQFTDDYNVADPPSTEWDTALSASGLDASAIRVGYVRGGSNRILNSGFEMADFQSPTVLKYDTAGEWALDMAAADINIDVSGAKLGVTTFSY